MGGLKYYDYFNWAEGEVILKWCVIKKLNKEVDIGDD